MVRPWQIDLAAYHVKRGGVIAYPTEGVWGLGCDPENSHAVEQILTLKNRPKEKGLILISGQREHFDYLLAGLDASLSDRFREAQPRPTTWLVPDPDHLVSEFVKGKFESVALRVTDHPIVSALTHKLGHAIVSTSANTAGNAEARSIFKVRQYFGNTLDYILPGQLGGETQPSTIRNLPDGRVMRP